MSGFRPLAVANELIRIATSEPGEAIDHLRLQKELYIAHGLHLALADCPLLSEGFRAWQYGPVSPDVYHAAKPYQSWGITGPLSNDTLAQEQSPLAPDMEYARALLKHVWLQYKGWSSFQLVDLTHRQGTPWSEVTKGGTEIMSGGRVIPDELIQRYYKRLLKR